MEGPPPTPRPPGPCGSPGPSGPACWSLDARLAALLVTLAAAFILMLLYRLLQLRHRLLLAAARPALQYYGFHHSATYTLRHAASRRDLLAKEGAEPDASPPDRTATAAIAWPLPPPLPPPVPPPPLPPRLQAPPTLTLTPPAAPAFPLLHLPAMHAAPPSPQRSWGARSDADVYSRIGAFRPSRLRSQSTVILFEHSSL